MPNFQSENKYITIWSVQNTLKLELKCGFWQTNFPKNISWELCVNLNFKIENPFLYVNIFRNGPSTV